MASQKDSIFGMVSQSYPIYEDGFEQNGTIYVCEGGIVVKYNGKLIRSPFSYVKKIEKVSELPLGKVSVILKMYDQLGQVHDMAVGLNDMHYEAFRKFCPDAEPR
ncbi:MAG: hypothetical protein WC492_01975 [Candidatus Micrarchaeia archaeon]